MSKNYCPYCMTPVPENESCSACGLTAGTYISSPHHLPPGTILMDRYLVGRVLGEGGFGITYIGCDLRLELKVAIKEYYPVDRATRNASSSLEVTNFIGPSAKSFERGKQKFLGEAQVMARMDKQQAIVSVRDFFELNNTAYIVMEYIEGITFRELVEKKGGRIAPEELFPMIEPLFHALTIMHENGLIHRDISPDNLMLENGKIRLLDFGCAREASRGTETMTIALKHGYAPIEQYQQKGQGPWTDIYALSATIYYCLTGKIPPQALDRITEDELLLPSKLGVHLSARQEKALLKGMKLQPNCRFSGAEEMWRAIYVQADEENKEDPAQGVSVERADAGKRNKKNDMQYEPVMKTEMGETGADQKANAQDADTEKSAGSGNAAGEDAVGEEKSAAGENPADGKLQIPDFFKQRKFLIGAGIAAACVVLFSAIWVSRRHAGEDAQGSFNADTQDAMGEAGEGQTGLPDSPDMAKADFHSFDNAYMFTSGESEEFERLMADDSVESVIMNCENVAVSRAVITKPVLLPENVFWPADSLIIEEGGYLQIEGNLDMGYSGYIRAYGDKLCFCVTEGGMFQSDNVFIWLENEDCFAMKGDNGGIESPLERRLVFSEAAFENSNVCSVTDFASLQSAIEEGVPISIDADIVMEEDVAFSVPVRISENVTLKRADNKETFLSICKGSVLLNDGTLEENLLIYDGGTVINNGVMNNDTDSMLRIVNESVLVNMGTLHTGPASCVWDNALLINAGELNCYGLCLFGGNMANMGHTVLEKADAELSMRNASRFFNKAGGVLDIQKGVFYNGSWLNNCGEIQVGYGGNFTNTLLINNGSFRAVSGAYVREGSVFYGEGQYDVTGAADLKIYPTLYWDPDGMDGIVEVRNEKELLAAMEAAGADAVYIKADITVHKDLVVKKNLFFDNGCSLTMEDGAAVINDGRVMMLKDGAALRGGSIAIREDGQLYMQYDSTLYMEENGELILDGSAIWGWGANIVLNNAELIMKNRAAFGFDHLKSVEAYNGRITLQNGSVLAMPPDCDEFVIDGSTVTLDAEGGPSYFYTVTETEWKDCALQIDAGVFENCALDLSMRDCSIEIAQGAEMCSFDSNLSLLGETTLNNWGNFLAAGWDEYSLTMRGKMVNYGNMDFGMSNMEFSNPIENQGYVSGVSRDE